VWKTVKNLRLISLLLPLLLSSAFSIMLFSFGEQLSDNLLMLLALIYISTSSAMTVKKI